MENLKCFLAVCAFFWGKRIICWGGFNFFFLILELSVVRDSMKKEKNGLKACSFPLALFHSAFISSTSCDAEISLLCLVTKKRHTQLFSFVGDDLLKPDCLTCMFSEDKVLSALTHFFVTMICLPFFIRSFCWFCCFFFLLVTCFSAF